MDKPNPLEANADERNTGLAREGWLSLHEAGRWTRLGGFIPIFFFQNRCMLNEVNTKIKLTRSKDNLLFDGNRWASIQSQDNRCCFPI